MRILNATLDDARTIAEVHVRSWQQAYKNLLPDTYLGTLSVDKREELWLDVLACPNSNVLIASEDFNIVGFLSYGASRDKKNDAPTAEIMALYVAPEYWHKGIGKALWQACREDLSATGYQSVVLWVVAGNLLGINFYEAMGFQQEHGMVEPLELACISLLEQRYLFNLRH